MIIIINNEFTIFVLSFYSEISCTSAIIHRE